ncbi:TPA: tape measure protein [Enterococcus faecalis]
MAETMSIQAVLTAVDKNFTDTMQQAEKSSSGLDDNVKKTNFSILDIAKGVGVFKLVDVGVNAVTNSLGSAISRFDTLNQYPKVLQSLGASAEDSDRGIQILSNGIDGLPTKLDDVAATSQQMFLVFRDADKASESTIALNNALLASGSSGDKAARGTEAYLKMLRSGKVDMDTWMSLQDTMGIGLDKIAKQLLGAEASTDDLYKALQSGKISIDDFNGSLVGMSDELGDLARVNTKGIGTSFSNMANAIGKGVANSITALDELVVKSGLNSDGIAGIFDVLKGKINDSFTAINKAIVGVSPYVEGFIGLLSKMSPLIPPLTISVISLATAFTTMKIVNTVNAWFSKMNNLLGQSKIAMNMYTTATKSGAKSTVAFEAVQKATNGAMKVSTILYGAVTGQVKLMTAAKMVLTTVSKGLYAALGPIGIALGAIAAVGATVAWVYKSQTKESKELKESSEDLKNSVDQVGKSQQDAIIKSQLQAQENTKLKDEIFALSAEESKSSEQKEILSQKVEQLNGRVDGLSMAYDAEKDSLNLSNEESAKRLELQSKIQAGADAEERMIELQKKQREATEAQAKAEELVASTKQKLFYWGSELKNAEEALSNSKQAANEIDKQIAADKQIMADAEKAKMEQLQNARNQMVEQGKIDYQSLSDTQKTAFDSMQTSYNSLLETTTNVFSQIEQKQTISLDQMIENLRKNEEAMSKWSSNVKILAERGVDQGIIAQLEKMGPAGAEQAERLVKETSDELGNLTPEGDAKLKEFKGVMTSNMAETTHGMAKIVGDGSEPIVAEFEKTAKKSMQSFSGQFKDSDLQQIGKDVNAGIAKGLGVNVGEVQKAAENSANKLDESYRHALGIHSPSRVMIENGTHIIAGLVRGIESNQSLPANSMQNIASRMVDSMQHLPSALQNVGFNAMIGFNNGLVSAGNTAISTANSIASQVANTMRKALDIHSPSRVMREIGSFVGEGLAIGMEESAKYVNRASDTLAKASMIEATSSYGGIMSNNAGTPAEFNFNFGGSNWRAFVSDITNTQNRTLRLERGMA